MKKVFLKISHNSHGSICASIYFLIKLQKNKIPTRVFSREFNEVFKSTYFAEYINTAASVSLPICSGEARQKNLFDAILRNV